MNQLEYGGHPNGKWTRDEQVFYQKQTKQKSKWPINI